MDENIKVPNSFKHGHASRAKGESSEYMSWTKMKFRCTNPKYHAYDKYGGKGIKVCDRWLGKDGFFNFLEDMGIKPDKSFSIERIDISKDYCPENCKWASKKEQARNKSNSKRIEYKGETKTLVEWSEILQLPYATLQARIDSYSWSIEKAFETPIRKNNKTK